MMKRFCVAALVLAACQSKTERTGIDLAASSTAVATASTTASSTAAMRGGYSDALVTTVWTDTKAVMDTSLDAPNFQCAPKVVTRKDTITLRAEVPHGGWLTVVQPDSTTFTLTSPLFDETHRGFTPLVDPEAFKNMLILRFRADIRARPYIYGRDTLEPVFVQPGEYVFTIGENLATEYDEEDPNWHCTVRFIPSP